MTQMKAMMDTYPDEYPEDYRRAWEEYAIKYAAHFAGHSGFKEYVEAYNAQYADLSAQFGAGSGAYGAGAYGAGAYGASYGSPSVDRRPAGQASAKEKVHEKEKDEGRCEHRGELQRVRRAFTGFHLPKSRRSICKPK
mmetsp:Transcript_80333/g.217673  ORF Transcript_80333/g.217673 Transcript_80333/m.217673 type:complete len:138 (+) Transcript_80333:3-416(+)